MLRAFYPREHQRIIDLQFKRSEISSKHCKWGVKKKPKNCHCEVAVLENPQRRWLNGGDKEDNGQVVCSQQEEWGQGQGQSEEGLLTQDSGQGTSSWNSLSSHGLLSTQYPRVQTQEEIANILVSTEQSAEKK